MAAEQRQRLAQIGLMWAGNLGPAGFRRLMAHFGSAAAVLETSAEQLAKPSLRLEAKQIEAICGLEETLPQIEDQIEALGEQNVAVVCDFEPDYPQILLDIPNPPPVLCMAGRLLPLDDPAIAVVGTRRPTEDGYQMAYELGQALAGERVTVASGLAQGCDTGGHAGALAGDGRTIAVLGSGITVIHPRENLDLAWQIAEHGALISEAPPDAHPSVARLMARNRLQSGLARAIIVVESSERGGTMQTAQSAERQGRPVYAVGWPREHEMRTGNARLLARGASTITGPEQAAALRESVYLHKQKMQIQGTVTAAQRPLFEDA